MEKVRVALEVLKKYHFWILLASIVLITFGTWFMATGDRASQYDSQKKLIDGQFTTVTAISSTRDHPSDSYIKGIVLRVDGDVANATEEVRRIADIKTATESLMGNVSAAAERLFDDQRKTFKLPPVYPNNPAEQTRFEDDFWKVWNHKIADIEKPPAEATNKEQFELDKTFRLQYRDQIKEIFPDLFKRIDLRTAAEGAANAPGGERGAMRGAGAADDPTKQGAGVLDWPGATELTKRFENWNDIPTTIQIMLAQEDLWVYESLLNVIRNTNNCAKDKDKNYEPPASHKEAPIKEIQALEIGNDAAQSWAGCENAVFVFSGDSGGSAAATSGAPGGPGPTGPMAPMGGGRGQASYIGNAATSGGSASSLLAGRYVDNSGKPLADPTQDPNQEFRMMPVNLRVVMEQRAIPRLLIECANSNMRIDVREVRILEEKPPAFDVNGSSTGGEAPAGAAAIPQMGGAPGGGRRGMGGRGMMGRVSSQGLGNAAQNGEFNYSEESADPNAPPVPVEIQGIIYIYNPPAPQSANGTAAAPTTGAVPVAPAAPGATAPSPVAPTAPAATTPPPAASTVPPAAPGPVAPAK